MEPFGTDGVLETERTLQELSRDDSLERVAAPDSPRYPAGLIGRRTGARGNVHDERVEMDRLRWRN